MTEPDWFFFGMAVGLSEMLAGIVVLATGAILTINLIRLRSAVATSVEMQQRRRIVNPCLIMIGAASALWATMMTIYLWWFIEGEAPFVRMLLHL